MGDDLDISHGGALAVDTDGLRDVEVRLRGVAHDVATSAGGVRRAGVLLEGSDDGGGISVQLSSAGRLLEEIAGRTEEGAVGVGVMAEAYELVELRSQRALMTEEAAGASALTEEIARLEASDPRLATMADYLTIAWEEDRFDDLTGQAELLGGAVGAAFPFLVRLLTGTAISQRRGVVPPGAVLQGYADPVRIAAVASSSPSRPPGSLEDAFSRFPGRSGAQVRVEKYTFPDGSRQFVAYVAGTQAPTAGGAEPWDMGSNVELYENQRSASYQATVDALAAAGARPGDVVHAFGHSQGGMIVDRLAMESDYRVATVVTAGSPIEPTLPDDVLSVQLRHTDDPVSALAAGGSAAGTGSPESIVVRREADPAPALHDLWLRAHLLDEYAETAAMVDSSGDVRVEAVDALWEELGAATEIEATEFHAERIEGE